MRSYARARLLSATALAVVVLVALAPVAGAAAPPKFQVTVTDDFSSESIRFVVATVPSVVDADTYKVGLANNSIGPHVLVAVGGLPPGRRSTARAVILGWRGPYGAHA
jgi:hypothetical protein